MCVITASPVSGQLPYHQYSIYLPFCTGDNALLQKVSDQLYEEFSDELVTSFETKYNQKLLAKMVLDSYEIFSSAPIEKFSDLSGKKIGGSGRNLLWLENTGAVGIQSNMGDGYTSLQTGLISGQFCRSPLGCEGKLSGHLQICDRHWSGFHYGRAADCEPDEVELSSH